MSAVLDPPAPDSSGVAPPGPTFDPAFLQLMVDTAARDQTGLGEAELIDQIAELESLAHAVAALQADRIREFARTHAATRAELEGAGLDPRKLESSIVAQVAHACGVSPTVGRSRLRAARDLHSGLDHVRALFTSGKLSTTKTSAVVAGTADLDIEERAQVDRELAGYALPALGLGKLRNLVRKLAAKVAPKKFRARAEAAAKDRRVTLRPGEDGMSWLTAHLPVEQGAACLAALMKAVKALWADPRASVTRSKGQTMADTLVERLTGQDTAEAVNVEIQALVPLEALIDPDADLPAAIPGHAPIPVDRLLSSRAGRLALRRLITHDGVVIGGDSRQRAFAGVLADLIRARDDHRCREPYCDAPIRHIDHIRRSSDGGLTEFDNGRGVCEFHNYVREQPGWTVRTSPEGIRTTTPTGHTYLSPLEPAA